MPRCFMMLTTCQRSSILFQVLLVFAVLSLNVLGSFASDAKINSSVRAQKTWANKRTVASPASTLTGPKLRISQVMRYSYDAGFQAEEQLTTILAIAIAESQLYTRARNWHPEKGFRPASDIITVVGPRSVWRNESQMHSDRGIWQFATFWYSQVTDRDADDPASAARWAFTLSEGGTNYSLWDSYTFGFAQRHFDRPFNGWMAVRPLVKKFLSVEGRKHVAASNNPSGIDASGPVGASH